MPFTDPGAFSNGSASPPLSAAFFDQVRKGLDATVNRRGSVSAVEYGAKLDGTTDDTAAIQAALNTGADVIIAGTAAAPGVAKTTATLQMPAAVAGQSLTTRRASIQPAFIGDVIQITAPLTRVDVTILGTLQPATGDYSNVASIRIGSVANNWNPQQSSVAYCDVRNFKGAAVVWENGSMVDFTHFHADTVAGDGIKCVAGPDNYHGWFANTHIVSASGRGFSFYNSGDGTDLSVNQSRHHVFQDAKAFGCGQNFYFETRSNVGTVFSEQGVNPDTFTSQARGNNIDFIETATAFEAVIDNGIGNTISGYSQNNAWETKRAIIRVPQLGATRFNAVTHGTYTVPSTSVGAGTTAFFSSGIGGLGTNRVVEATLFTSNGAGIIVSAFIGSDGALNFQAANLSGSSKTVTGTISYVVWSFDA